MRDWVPYSGDGVSSTVSVCGCVVQADPDTLMLSPSSADVVSESLDI